MFHSVTLSRTAELNPLSNSPSRQKFGTLVVNANGNLQGGAGDVFELGRNLTNNSSQASNFDWSRCWIVLSGTGVQHRVAWPGADGGAVANGYFNNFAIAVLMLTSGTSLLLLDGNGAPGGAIYTEVLRLDDGVSQIANISTSGGMSIYYNPANAGECLLGQQHIPIERRRRGSACARQNAAS